jgi:hypothetical protein
MSNRGLCDRALLIGREHVEKSSWPIGQHTVWRYAGDVHRQPRVGRLRHLPGRIVRAIRALFGGGDWRRAWDDAEGGVGVREPRRPLAPTLAGGAALELPPDDSDDSL